MEVILDIAEQIAAGLARAHEAGIIHRDIKPANVIPRYRYRLAKLYEEHGQSARALEEYQRFLGFWEGADPTLPEMIDAVTRVAALREMTSG